MIKGSKDIGMLKAINRNIILALAAVWGFTVSCSQAYPGLDYDKGDEITNTETYDKTPIMVFVNEQYFFSISSTRSSGTGAFTEYAKGDKKKYNNSTFYIYAFRAGADSQGGPFGGTDPDLRKSFFALGHEKDKENTSCLVDGPDYDFGMPTRPNTDGVGALEPYLSEGSGSVLGEDNGIYYSSVHHETGYNFFAYFVDNLDAPEYRGTKCIPHRESKDMIWYDLTIDGTQDIMCGYAPRLTKQRLDDKYKNANIKNKEDREKIERIGGYSTFAAHRGVYPIVEMKHRLSQFRFRAFPGEPSADSILITAVKMKGWDRGRMVVAATNKDTASIGFTPYTDGQKTDLMLRDTLVFNDDGTPDECPPLGMSVSYDYDEYKKFKEDNPLNMGYMTKRWRNEWKNLAWNQRDNIDVGGSLMLFPDSVYEVTLEYRQLLRNGRIQDLKAVYRLTAEQGAAANPSGYLQDEKTGRWMFRAGKYYTMNIAVYGLQPIIVVAEIDNWDSGGDIPIEPDDPDYNDNTGMGRN